jgi:chromosome partitioning protein
MRVWTIANQKGGVGKTTTTVSLSGLLAGMGYRVLMIDVDPHGSLTSYFKYNPDDLDASVFQLFQHKGEVPRDLPRKVVLTSGHRNLDLIGASTALAVLERQAAGQGGMGLVLKRTLHWLRDDYDFVLIDTPPLLGALLINSMAACHRIIIPTQTEFLALKGLERMLRTLEMVNQSQRRELVYTILPTLYDRRTHAATEALTMLRSTYGDLLWSGAIGVDTRLRDASQAGVPPSVYDPNSRAVKMYTLFLQFLLTDTASEAAVSAG